ncbi:MAG TPA: hypothetical protein VNP71_01495 [Thermoplasmata archaeon]|nr:hypothetical protein [Thermoplasmata archaeon]
MSSALLSRACAIAFALIIGLLAFAALIPAANAVPSPNPIQPAAMTVTVVLDKSSYLSGDTATAQAIVYRTPAPGNYTYVWRVRNFFFQLLNTTTTAGATFRYPIALDYTGTLRFEATVDDGQGTVAAGQQSATVAQAYMALSLDRGDYNPGDTISAFYGVTSHVITNPSYAYEVDDTNAVIVLSGTTSATFFSFRTPNPSSRSYTFHVTATDRGNSTQAQATISQAAGFVLGLSFEKTSYAAGETVHAHLILTAKGTASLPSQFRWALSTASASVSSITTGPTADLFLTIPQGTGNGGLLVFANELNTGASAFQTVQVGPTGSSFWSSEVGGFPAFAIVLSVLFLLLLIAVIAVWRRGGGGFGPIGGKAAVPPPPPEGPVRSAPTSPMSINCRRCGKPIDLSTSRRPIEVMCPSCGETQVVT